MTPGMPWARTLALATVPAGVLLLAGGAFILESYLKITCAVWGIPVSI